MKLTIVLLAFALTVVAAPFAVADETNPDCEEDQPLIGYRSTDFLKDTVRGQGLNVCEGEHWDGQDTVQPDQTPSCNPSTSLVPTDLFVGFCTGTAPDTGSQDDPLTTGARVSSANLNEVYAGADIHPVGMAFVYVSEDRTAVYVHDNTPGNVLATIVSTPRITQGYVSENDCSQDVYQTGAYSPPSQCGRDNTAITVEYETLV